MANIFTKIASAFIGWFTSGRAKRDAEAAMRIGVDALPYLKIAADIVVGLTPTQVDDIAWGLLKAKYPGLFDGSIRTEAELKAYALQVAATLLRQKFPKVDTTVAVLATQMAYVQARAEQSAPNVVPTLGITKSPLSL